MNDEQKARELWEGPIENSEHSEESIMILAAAFRSAREEQKQETAREIAEIVKSWQRDWVEDAVSDAAMDRCLTCVEAEIRAKYHLDAPESCCGHASDCAVHNAPALPTGSCDCKLKAEVERLNAEIVVKSMLAFQRAESTEAKLQAAEKALEFLRDQAELRRQG
jgi:hypothetical protein